MSKEVTDEPGWEDNIEYYAKNKTFRVATVKSGDTPIEFTTWSLEEWGEFETAEIGVKRVREVTAERLGTDNFGSGVGRPPEFISSDTIVIWLHLTTNVNRKGTVIGTPTVSLDQLAIVAPRHVEATVSVEGDSYSRKVPVVADQQTLRLL